jgi:uncharacterized protein (DUF433 family)
VSLKSGRFEFVKNLERITLNPAVMGGRPCIRGMRVTVGTVVGLVATGKGRSEILKLYPYLEEEDITQALSYAAWRVKRLNCPLHPRSGNEAGSGHEPLA